MDSNPRFTAALGKGQWFATVFMGKLLKRDNMYPVRFAKDSFEKLRVSGFRGVWCLLAAKECAFEVRAVERAIRGQIVCQINNWEKLKEVVNEGGELGVQVARKK